MDAERQRAADVKSDVHLEDRVVDGAEVGSEADRGAAREILRGCVCSRTRPVSYTHLTLPTKA